MNNILRFIGITLFFVFGLLSSSLSQEQLTITTYYPSPFGNYRDLTVSDDLRLETDPTAPAADGPQIEWRTGTPRHWNIDQLNDRLRFFTEDANNANRAERIGVTEGGDFEVRGAVWIRRDQGSGCIIISYGSASGNTMCPPGTTLNSGLSGATPGPNGGIFYCCRP